MKRFLEATFLLLMSAAVSVTIAEYCLRNGIILSLAFTVQDNTYILDSDLLYRLKPNAAEDIDGNGYRRHTNTGQAINTVLIGDSFAFAVNVEPQQTIAAQLDALPGADYRTVNMGVSGYGPDQAMLTLQKNSAGIRPKTVVLTLFPANDFNDLAKNDLFQINAAGDLQPNPDSDAKKAFSPLWLSMAIKTIHTPLAEQANMIDLGVRLFNDTPDVELYLDKSSHKSQKKIALMRAVLAETQEQVSTLGARMLVVIIPAYQNFGGSEFHRQHNIHPQKRFRLEDITAEITTSLQIDTINLHQLWINVEDPAVYFDLHDLHLSPKGYQTVAEEINRHLQAKASTTATEQ